MLTLNLNPIFKARGIERPYSFLVKAGLTPHTANVLLNSKTKVFRLDHIEKLCQLLKCEPNDLLVWYPNKNEIIANDHPLTKLKHSESPAIDIKATLLNMPYKELKSFSSKLNEEVKGEVV
jgi:DNA-binding Xre family transcriptional regulator